jgi:hypothetical protein
MLMAMFLIVGCQTTQSAETETKPEVVKEVNVLPKQKEVVAPKQEVTQNPFQNIDIPARTVVTSTKPVICGRIDVMVNRMKERFGEVPIFMGKLGVQNPGETAKQVVAMMVYNKDTGSYTFLEQMPNEERLMCILSSGHGKLNSPSLGASL